MINVKQLITPFLIQEEMNRSRRWLLHGAGPDTVYEADTGTGYHHYFNASNGVKSEGDIYRFGP